MSLKDFRKISHPEPKISNNLVSCRKTDRQTEPDMSQCRARIYDWHIYENIPRRYSNDNHSYDYGCKKKTRNSLTLYAMGGWECWIKSEVKIVCHKAPDVPQK